MAENAQDYAVVVGLNDYPDYGGGGRSLRGAIADATAFAAWLRDTASGGGLPHDNVALITSSLDPLAPAQDQIDDALDEIVGKARASGGRRFYFYFSGHGHVSGEARHDVALCLPRWSRNRRNAALSSSHYLDYIVRCTPFTEVVMLLDCCRVKQVAALGLGSVLNCPVPVAVDRKILIAYASEFLKSAFEGSTARGDVDSRTDDNGAGADEADADEVRGYFTEALLSGLRAGAARPEGGVTARGLKQYLELYVEPMSGGRQKPQIPIDMSESAADSMLFGSALPEANVEISFHPDRSGTIELIGPDAEVVKSGDASGGPWRLRLRRGVHILHDVATADERVIRFTPAAEVTRVEF
jgi:uncharacterized caspase-like protein